MGSPRPSQSARNGRDWSLARTVMVLSIYLCAPSIMRAKCAYMKTREIVGDFRLVCRNYIGLCI